MTSNEQELERYAKLESLRKAYADKRLSHSEIGAFLDVSREMVSRWMNGRRVPPQKNWRQSFITWLLEDLDLRKDHQQFYSIWQNAVVGGWNWDPLTNAEITDRNLDPPLALFLNVPSRPLHLRVFGRDTLLANLRQRLLANESLALIGKPGVGKTMLAIELARDRAIMTRFPDGILWVKIGQTFDVMGELTNLAEGFGIDVAPLKSEAAQSRAIKNAIGRRHILVVLDDVWDLEPVRHFFHFDGPNCCIVLTTRNKGIARSFFADPDKVVEVAELEYEKEEDPANALLCFLAPEACAAEPDTAQKLVKTVGGLPLALVLLGGFLSNPERSIFSEERKKALAEMEDPRRRLQLARQRLGAHEDKALTLQEVIALSIDTLLEYMIPNFYALGAFAAKPERFDYTVAQAVTGADILTLSTLIARHLLEIDQQEQLTIHQVIADVARTRTPAEAVKYHREFYLAKVKENPDNWKYIERMYGQIKWAWAQLLARDPEDERLFDFVRLLNPYQNHRGLWNDTIDWTKRGLQLAEAQGRQEEVCNLLVSLGNIYQNQGRWEDAIALHKESLHIFRELGDRHGEALTLATLGHLCINQGKWIIASESLEENLHIFRELGDRRGEVVALHALGSFYSDQGKWDEAIQLYEENLHILRELVDRHGEALTLATLGNLYLYQRRWEDAIALHKESLHIFRELGDRHGEASTLQILGNCYGHQGKWIVAAESLEESLGVFRELGDRHGEASTLYDLSKFYVDQGKWIVASESLEESLHIFRELGDRQGEAQALTQIGIAYRSRGNYQMALESYKQALLLARKEGLIPVEFNILGTIGEVYSRLGDNQQALELLQQLGTRISEDVILDENKLLATILEAKQKALEYFQQALVLLQLLHIQGVERLLRAQIAEVFTDLGEFDKAEEQYSIISAISGQSGGTVG